MDHLSRLCNARSTVMDPITINQLWLWCGTEDLLFHVACESRVNGQFGRGYTVFAAHVSDDAKITFSAPTIILAYQTTYRVSRMLSGELIHLSARNNTLVLS